MTTKVLLEYSLTLHLTSVFSYICKVCVEMIDSIMSIYGSFSNADHDTTKYITACEIESKQKVMIAYFNSSFLF